ncbi:hypothetical protein COO59_12140 [Mixta theicola]|uniref:Uncharacterized protein n=1 Tax=Mixta theicola TaxID=1458355 RepID=A0A2K1Q8L7_9GAMM|nr:hypothetical protein COO59_12140 [Mixta theicola]
MDENFAKMAFRPAKSPVSLRRYPCWSGAALHYADGSPKKSTDNHRVMLVMRLFCESHRIAPLL